MNRRTLYVLVAILVVLAILWLIGIHVSVH